MLREKEIWCDIKGYEGIYQISSHGRVKSLEREIIGNRGSKYTQKELIKKLSLDQRGYPIVSLCKKAKCKTRKVHRYVAETFIPNPENKPQVNHLKGKENNYYKNLEWNTNRENMSHAVRNNLMASGVRNGKTKFDEIKCLTLITLLNAGKKISEVSEMAGINRSTIYSIKCKHNWKQLSDLVV